MTAPSELQVRPLFSSVGPCYCYESGTHLRLEACQRDITEDLRTHGFSLVQVSVDRAEKAMNVAEERRFALSQTAKHMLSDSAEEGYVTGTHKEMFYFTSQSGSVQQPPYWYIPTAPERYYANAKALGGVLFNGINAHALNLLRDMPFEQEAFVDMGDYSRWINAVRDSSAHVMTSFLYEESNPDTFHAAAHVDKGLLSICTNPTDLEVCVKGHWLSLGAQPPGVVAVLTGYTLERATNGLFSAARHRVRNSGMRRSRVMKLRLDPSLVIKPASVIAYAPPLLLEDFPPPLHSLQVRELMKCFTSIHESVNASSSPRTLTNNEENLIEGTSLGYFDMLPSNLVLSIFDWLRDVHDLYRLSLVSHSLHRVANSDVLCIRVAESSHIDWGAALDRLDRGVPSHARASDTSIGPMVTSDLLLSVAERWISLVGSELRSSTRMRDKIQIRIRDQMGQFWSYQLRFNQSFRIVQHTYAQFKGVSSTSLRFLLDGQPITGDDTCYGFEMEMDDQVDCMLEQRGD